MRRQVAWFSIVSALLCTLSASPLRAQDSNIREAQGPTEAWLALVDAQSYAESWDTAAANFRNAVPTEKWQAAVRAVRGPLGDLKSRTLKSAKVTATLPAAPDGEYVVFQFDASFAQKAAAVETVTAVREKDGSWHVGGYFIR